MSACPAGEPLRLLSTLRQLLAEGGAAQLFRGALPEIGGLAPRAAAALSTLEYSQRLFRSWHPQRQLTAPAAYMAGALSGVSEAVVFNPFQARPFRPGFCQLC